MGIVRGYHVRREVLYCLSVGEQTDTVRVKLLQEILDLLLSSQEHQGRSAVTIYVRGVSLGDTFGADNIHVVEKPSELLAVNDSKLVAIDRFELMRILIEESLMFL